MAFSSIIMLPLLLLFLAIWAGLIYLLILLIAAYTYWNFSYFRFRDPSAPWGRSSRPTGCAAR